MAITKQGLISVLEQPLTSSETALDLLIEWGDRIQEYINDNAEVNYSWIGIQILPVVTTPPPDPVITAVGEISDIDINLTFSESHDRNTLFGDLSSGITGGVSVGMASITDDGFTVPPNILSSSPTIGNLSLYFTLPDDTELDQARALSLDILADNIINYVKQLIPAPQVGIRVAGVITYSGTATVLSIY